MTKMDDLKEALKEAEIEYDKVMKKWKGANTRFKNLDDEKIDIERTIMDIRTKMEDIAIEEGIFHDQMYFDFDIDKYGKRKHFIDSRREHNARWDKCACFIQCPECKKYNIKIEYKLMRNVFGGERIIFDIVPLNGDRHEGYYYCSDCLKKVKKDVDAEEEG